MATVGHVLLASMAAFPLAKLHFPGDKIVFSIIVTSLLFTADVLALPSYLVMAKLHLIDTYMALIFPRSVLPWDYSLCANSWWGYRTA